MKVIGLTGPSGSGKGIVASFFEYHNIKSIDTDAVYRDVVTPPSECLCELSDEFGPDIIMSDGTLDRRMLAKIVFSDKSKQARLNEITHKYILEKSKEIMSELDANGERAVIFDVPLLFESGFDAFCDVTVSVIADKEERIKRIIKRDGITSDAAISRINAQMPDEYYISRSDYVLYNDGTPEELKKSVDELIAHMEVDLF